MRTTLLATLVVSMFAASPAHATDPAEVDRRLDALMKEIESLKAEVARMKAEKAAAPAVAPVAPVAPAASAAPTKPTPVDIARATGEAPKLFEQVEKTTFFGYGELNYYRPTHDTSNTTADAARVVLGFEHRWNERTRLVTELEWEHAVTSVDDRGESEVEQAYVEYMINQNLSTKVGLFLMPVGLLNEHHEPTQYYGVARNFVETAIIPTTWREGGLLLHGNYDSGLSWDAGISTGFDLSKWDATSTEGQESPLGSIHQELQLAKAKDLSAFGALNYRGVPGLLVGASIFSGKAGQGTPDFPAPDARVTIWDAHARWTPGDFDIWALYTRGHISDTANLNVTLVGNPTLVPEDFFGWYMQGAFKIWNQGEMSATPFVRYERYNTGWKYATLPAGLTPDALPTEGVWTAGLNFYLNPSVVFKMDYQKFKEDTTRDRFDLGVGYQF
ncbi:MAG TPA: hypothetical protein VGI57_11560 [Usitatibacter sp.]